MKEEILLHPVHCSMMSADRSMMDRRLTHNHGTEKDTGFKGYHNGNDEPQGLYAFPSHHLKMMKKVMFAT